MRAKMAPPTKSFTDVMGSRIPELTKTFWGAPASIGAPPHSQTSSAVIALDIFERRRRLCIMKRSIGLLAGALFGLYACDQQGGAAAPSLAVGSPAPAVSMTLHDGRVVTLKELRGHNVLVYFYPKDDTPG
jgi:hypothetical protein